MPFGFLAKIERMPTGDKMPQKKKEKIEITFHKENDSNVFIFKFYNLKIKT